MTAATIDRRARGVVPARLQQLVANETPDFDVRLATKVYDVWHGGLPPAQLRERELDDFREAFGQRAADEALGVLGRIGYGAPVPARPRRERRHGSRRDRRLDGVLGKLPRALALRMPTTANTRRRDGRMDGEDIWGPVSCSRTLTVDHLGLVAAAGGLWAQRAQPGERFADCTASELAHLILPWGRRPGGKDTTRVHRLLAELEQLELSATVTDRGGDGASDAHAIPCGPVAAVQRRVGDRWVDQADYAAAAEAATDEEAAELSVAEHAPAAGLATVRIHLADWVIAELSHPKRRPVFVHFDVWRHLRPSARRVYCFLQGSSRDGYDDKVRLFLGRPMLFTLGLTCHHSRAAEIVRHDLTTIWHADERYHGVEAAREGRGGFGESNFGRSQLPQFRFRVPRRASHPRPDAPLRRSQPRRPRGLRELRQRVRRYEGLRAVHVRRGDVSPGHARQVGVDEARAELAAIRESLVVRTAAPPRDGP